MNLSFRKAEESDIPVLQQLAHKIWHEHYPSIITVEQIDFMLNDRYSAKALAEGMKRGEKIFLAYVDDEPVAFGAFELKKDFYYLHKFYVDVSKHRGGIGYRFFNFLLSQMDNTKPIRLQVNRTNYKAINFYFKMGFIIEYVDDFDIGGGYFMNDFVMLRKPT